MNHKYSTIALIFILFVAVGITLVEGIEGGGTNNAIAKFFGGKVVNSSLIDDGVGLTNVSTICTTVNGLCAGLIYNNNFTTYVNTTNNITNNFTLGNSSFQCSGTDKLMNVSIVNGLINGTCATDQTGSGSGVPLFDLIDRDFYYRNTGFESVTAGYLDPWVPTAIGSGTSAVGTGLVNHPSVATISSSALLNSGYAYQITNPATYLLGQHYVSVISFKPIVVRNLTANFENSSQIINMTQIRFGFMDVFTTATITDGVYLNITQNSTRTFIVNGRTRKTNAQGNTSTNFMLQNNTWYTAMIYMSGSNNVSFYIYNETQSLIWSDYIDKYIPNATGQETSHALIVFKSGNASITQAQILMYVDYMSVGINKSIIR